MGTKIATGRHGVHVNNVLTPTGQNEVDASARWLLDYCRRNGFTTVDLATSEEGRAIESGTRYHAILAEGGLTVPLLGHDHRFNPAGGLGAIAKGDPERGIPAYGKGMIRWWKEACDRETLPEGVEAYEAVVERVSFGLYELNSTDEATLLLVVCHGGVIEPGNEELVGEEVQDLPSAALVIADLDSLDFEIFDPATATP